MNKKIKILIIASALGLIALSLIQVYLIKNTYKLKRDAFLSEIKKEIDKIDNSKSLDLLENKWQKYALNEITNYHQKQGNKTNKDKKDLIDSLIEKTNSLNNNYIEIYHKKLSNKGFNFIKIQKRISLIVIKDSLNTDTIFFNKKNKHYLIGDKFDYKKASRISTSDWTTEFNNDIKINNVNKEVYYSLQMVTSDYMNIDGWKKIIIKRMASIFLLALFLFLFVFGLLFYSIKNLIKQKKIAEVKSDFINNITHELKTPLATLTLATKMLSINKEKTSNTEIIKTINRQNIRLQKLIDQVLNNSLGYKEIKLNKETVLINSFLNTILTDFKLTFQNKNYRLTTNLNSDKSLKIDKFYFTTAVLNILENAIKYNDKKYIKIEINADFINNQYVLSIKDNGMGIPKKEQQQLFEKFYRLNNKNEHNIKGLGLGLYYTNQIIKAHNGTINVSSKVEKETIFTIKLPC